MREVRQRRGIFIVYNLALASDGMIYFEENLDWSHSF